MGGKRLGGQSRGLRGHHELWTSFHMWGASATPQNRAWREETLRKPSRVWEMEAEGGRGSRCPHSRHPDKEKTMGCVGLKARKTQRREKAQKDLEEHRPPSRPQRMTTPPATLD